MKNLTKYAKAIMAVLGAVVGTLTTSVAGASTAQVVWTAASAGMAALMVFLVPNAKPYYQSDRGTYPVSSPLRNQRP